MDLDLALRISEQAALAAGKEVMRIYLNAGPLKVALKTDSSPITEADLSSNKIITAELASAFSDIPIVSEESVHCRPKNETLYWLVDPVDGTKEFIARNGEFTINIGLVRDGVPALGVIYSPALDELYYASAENGAFLSRSGNVPTRIGVSSRAVLQQQILVTSRSHRHPVESAVAAEAHFAAVRSMGSSLKGCLIAKGAADVYIRVGNTHKWDICAMSAIVTEAGGVLTDLDGRTISFEDPQRIIGGFLASNGTVHETLLDMARRHKII